MTHAFNNMRYCVNSPSLQKSQRILTDGWYCISYLTIYNLYEYVIIIFILQLWLHTCITRAQRGCWQIILIRVVFRYSNYLKMSLHVCLKSHVQYKCDKTGKFQFTDRYDNHWRPKLSFPCQASYIWHYSIFIGFISVLSYNMNLYPIDWFALDCSQYLRDLGYFFLTYFLYARVVIIT